MKHNGNEAMAPIHGRRRVVPVVAGLASVALVAACGSDSGTASDDLPNEGPVTISWYGSDERNAAVQEVVDLFSEENPDVTIETQPTTFDGHWDRLSVQSAANNLPCIPAMQSRYQARYEDRGSLLPLDDLIEDGTIDVSGIPEEILESQRAPDGNLYSIPKGIWYEGALLNVPLIEEEGGTPPDPSGTWEDYVDWAIEAQPSISDDRFAINASGGSVTQFQVFAIGRGESLFDDGEAGFSEQTLVDWFDLWMRAVEEGAAPSGEVTAEYQGVPTAQSMMATGRLLVSFTGDNNMPDFQRTLDQLDLGQVSLAPAPTGGPAQVVGANSWAISDNCTNVVDSAALIDFFINSSEGAFILQTQTGLPPVTSILEEMLASPDVDESIKDRITLYDDLRESGAVIDVWPDGTQPLITQLSTAWEEVVFGQSTSEDAAAAFMAQVETALSGL
ncbi:ABC transporter substrate-binding protein [Pseudactinotalea sp. Z1739]|uniref:ABC transporter substrate-binding protein n=1 Tax=Pseudactinotalea sp. Z1739 TaxID=3413028 RepID=UPI003C7CA954